MPRSRYRTLDREAPHFFTCTVVDWLPVFASPPIAQIILDSWKFLQESDRLDLFAFVIMENHIHWIASAGDLPKEVGDFKSFTARRIIDWLQENRAEHVLQRLVRDRREDGSGRTYQFWQAGSHAQMIGGEAMMRQKVEYIHANPVRRGYVDEPAHWRYSSARNYMGLPGILEVTSAW